MRDRAKTHFRKIQDLLPMHSHQELTQKFRGNARFLSAFVMAILFAWIPAPSAFAHPADIYAHSLKVAINPQGMSVRWEIKPGPMLASMVWYGADTDRDGTVSAQETQAWGETRASQLVVALDENPLPLQLDEIQLPDVNEMQAGTEFIVLILSTKWPDDANGHRLVLQNSMEEKNSINWFYVIAEEGAAFQLPVQESNRLTIDLLLDHSHAVEQGELLTAWDSGSPSLPPGQKKDPVMQTAEQVVPELEKNTPQDILIGLVRNGELSLSFYTLALGISLALGALHALTPGHGKTVVAAYLVGTRGTTRHAIALGSIVTLTHTGSVFLLGIVTLAASRYILPTSIIPILEVVSGVLIVGLGLYLLARRIRDLRRGGDDHHHHDHEHHHNHDHQHNHSHPIPDPEAVTWKSLIALGVSGGLVPCPDAIAILLVAVAINRIFLGLALILAFSLGLAIVLIAIGLAMVHSRRLFDRMDLFSRFAPAMPIVSAAAVVILGIALTYGASTRLGVGANSSMTEAGSTSAKEAGAFNAENARVAYLTGDESGHSQLVIANISGANQRALTDAAKGVIEYALSPDGTRAIYVLQTDDLRNDLWLVNLDGTQNREISACENAICSQPVWSPDGTRVIYERMELAGDSANLGLATLWWLDMDAGKGGAVFQSTLVPGTNPRFSPDGKWLSYSTTEGTRLYQLATGETRFIDTTLSSPANWSPDGKSLVIRDVALTDNQFVTQLFLYNLSTGTSQNLNADKNMENILAVWSPDGSQIAMVRRDISTAGGDELWVMNADGGNARQLSSDPDVLHGTVEWSPDGKVLLYDLYLLKIFPLESHLQIVDAATGKVTELGLQGFNPEWVGSK